MESSPCACAAEPRHVVVYWPLTLRADCLHVALKLAHFS